MSSQRLALSHIIRHGQRFVSLPHPVPPNDKHETTPSNSVRFSDIIRPLLGSFNNGQPSLQFSPLLGCSQWTPSLVNSGNGSDSAYTVKILGDVSPICSRGNSNLIEVGVQTEECGIYSANKVNPVARTDKAKWDLENLIGEELLKAGDAPDALNRFQAAASHGNANAMNNLAQCLFSGIGIACNKEKAFSLWEQSASLGNVDAMYSLAVCLIRAATAGDPKGDRTRATQLMRKAAFRGNVHAAFYLVVRYIRDSDFEAAENLVHIAARDEGYASEMESWTKDSFLSARCSQHIKEVLESNL